MDRKDEDGNILEPTIKGLRYHWTDHPLYDSKRYEWKIKGMTPEEIAQELEIDYNTAVRGRVYTDFATEAVELRYNPDKPLYVAIDNNH